jgi:bifunctional DNA-binding transcriptional regulator/antitoxin component of YhaV-PrlF toxin-antitoxin module
VVIVYELVKMSGKGELVIPQSLRKSKGFAEGDSFIAYPIDEGIVFKKIDIPELKDDFNQTAKDISKRFKKSGIKPKDVEEAVKWARKK